MLLASFCVYRVMRATYCRLCNMLANTSHFRIFNSFVCETRTAWYTKLMESVVTWIIVMPLASFCVSRVLRATCWRRCNMLAITSHSRISNSYICETRTVWYTKLMESVVFWISVMLLAFFCVSRVLWETCQRRCNMLAITSHFRIFNPYVCETKTVWYTKLMESVVTWISVMLLASFCVSRVLRATYWRRCNMLATTSLFSCRGTPSKIITSARIARTKWCLVVHLPVVCTSALRLAFFRIYTVQNVVCNPFPVNTAWWFVMW